MIDQLLSYWFYAFGFIIMAGLILRFLVWLWPFK